MAVEDDVVSGQPEASSAPETIEQVAQTQDPSVAKEAEAQREREKFIPRERFDDVYERMKRAEERDREKDELLRQMVANYSTNQPQPQEQPYVEEDPSEKVYKRLQPSIASMQEQVFGLRDERDREAFWRENTYISSDIKDEVEGLLSNFRKQGISGIKREDVLAHAIGKRQLPEMKKKAATPVAPPTPAVNKIAHAETGNSGKNSAKALEDMTPEEVDALPLEVLKTMLRGKVF